MYPKICSSKHLISFTCVRLSSFVLETNLLKVLNLFSLITPSCIHLPFPMELVCANDHLVWLQHSSDRKNTGLVHSSWWFKNQKIVFGSAFIFMAEVILLLALSNKHHTAWSDGTSKSLPHVCAINRQTRPSVVTHWVEISVWSFSMKSDAVQKQKKQVIIWHISCWSIGVISRIVYF